jgi:hypothetical protein
MKGNAHQVGTTNTAVKTPHDLTRDLICYFKKAYEVVAIAFFLHIKM